jgi:hypothetical protein
LTDVSGANVRALVLDPAIEDTHEINRTSYRIGFFSPRLAYETRYPAIPRALDALALICLVLGVAWTAVRGGLARATRWIGERIPDASPEAVASFRVVFGVCLLTVIFRRPVTAAIAADTSNVISGVHRALLQVFVSAPWMVDSLQWWIGIWGVLFIFGAFARIAFAALTAGVLAWALLYTTTTTYHTVSSLLLALLVLQGSRWSDAWSVDAWRRGRIEKADPKVYGFTVWLPGVILGVVLAAAAVAKLLDAGFAWILNGTVRYHFLSDSPQAMVDWGLWIGRSPALSVMLSFAAVAIEALVIVGALASSFRYRLLAGTAALTRDKKERDEVMLKFREKVVLLTEGLNRIDGFRALDPTATFYVVPNVARVCNKLGVTSHGLALYMLQGADDDFGIACLGGECFGQAGAGFLRFSCAESNERLRQALDFIPKALARTDRLAAWLGKNPQYRLAKPYAIE